MTEDEKAAVLPVVNSLLENCKKENERLRQFIELLASDEAWRAQNIRSTIYFTQSEARRLLDE